MTDESESVTPAFLRRLDAKIDRLIEAQADHGRRLTALELAVGNLVSTEMSHYGNMMLRIDTVSERLDRIEHRFDLKEA
jgi:hypothetical protein